MANPFDQFDDVGPMYGAPPIRDPLKEAADRRAEEAASLSRERFDYQQQRDQIVDARQGGAPGASPSANDQKLQAKHAALESLTTQINRVDELYQNGFKEEAYGIISSLGEYLPTNDAAQFNAAGAGLAEQGLAAFRVPGVGSQSDTELRQFVEANRPSSWDRDPAIEEKLKQLRVRVDATRQAMGLPAAQWRGMEPAAQAPAQQVFDGNLGGEQLQRSTNGYKTVDNPELAGVKGEYLRRLQAGAPTAEIIQFLRSAGVNDPRILKSAVDQSNFRRKNPNVPIEKYNISVLDDMDVPLSGVEESLNSAAQSAPGAYLMQAGQAASLNTLDDISGAMGGNQERAQIALADAGRSHPAASLAGGISGGVMAALTGEAGLARLGMAAGAPRALLADTAYGAGAGAGASEDNRLGGAATGGLAGLVGSGIGQGLTRGAGALASGVTDPSVGYVAQQQIPMTLGQAVGRSGKVGAAVKGVEDRLAGLPIVGDVINARRTEGIRAMNSKAFDKALEPINESIGNQVGEEAVSEANDLVSRAFQKALAGKSAQVDSQFLGDASAAIMRLKTIKRDNLGDEIVDQIEEATRGYFDPATGHISGEDMQALLGSLREIRQAYRTDPLGKRIGDSVKSVEKAVEGIFERQAPEVMPDYKAAKAAYRRVSILADAVNRGKNSEGVFTSGQLGMSDRGNSVKFDGKMGAASGKSPFQDFQRATQDVLPNRVPDSGTAGRLLVPGALVAGGAGVGAATGDAQSGATTGIGLATLLAMLYSKRGSAAMAGAFTKRGPKAKAIGQAVKKRSRIAGAGGATLAVQGTSLDQ